MDFLATSPTGSRRVLVLSATAASLVREGAKGVWIDVAFEGEWHGHPAGPFQLTASDFERIIANHRANPNDVPLDYEHASERGGEAPAAGWVKDFELRRDGEGRLHLWAFAELTDRAAARIDAGEYRYSSGVFDFAAVDFVTNEPIGCEMPSVALTNQPFIRGAEPIRLTATKVMTGASMGKIAIETLIKALKALDGEEVTSEQIAALMTLHNTGGGDAAAEAEAPAEASAPAVAATAPAAPVESPAQVEASDPPAEPVVAAADGSELDGVAAQLGMSPEELAALLMANLDAIAALAGGEMAPAEGQEPAGEMALRARLIQHQLKSVTAQRDALLESQRKREREDAIALTAKAKEEVDLLVSCGVILDDAAREDMRKLYLTDAKLFHLMAATLKPAVPIGVHASALQPPTEQTVAVPEAMADEIKGLRRMLKAGGVPEPTIEKKVRERVALRSNGAL